jgi:purine-nucleoside phosphorylase
MAPRPDPESVAVLLRKRTTLRPTLGLVLGSGYQHVLDRFTVALEIPFGKIAGFPALSVRGHDGKVLIGYLSKVPVLVLSGRAHYYEGHEMEAVTFPVRVLKEFGVEDLLLTSAAGGIKKNFRMGDFMHLTDHINLMGVNPIRGMTSPGRSRFVDLTRTYDRALNALIKQAASKCGARMHSGVYLAVAGPSYETPAEIRAFERLGADVVGMSMVPEAIVARYCGLKVAAVSCITNLAAGRSKSPLSHDQVLASGERMKKVTVQLLAQFVQLYQSAK